MDAMTITTADLNANFEGKISAAEFATVMQLHNASAKIAEIERDAWYALRHGEIFGKDAMQFPHQRTVTDAAKALDGVADKDVYKWLAHSEIIQRDVYMAWAATADDAAEVQHWLDLATSAGELARMKAEPTQTW